MRNLMETNLKTEMALATIRNCNITLGNFKSLKTPVGRLLQIEVIVMFTTFMFLLLITFSSWRRRRNEQKFGQFIYMVYNLSTFLLTYSLSLMHDFPSRNKLFPIWAMLLMITFGSTDSISAYSLDDNEQWKRNNWQLLTKSIWLVWLINLYFRDGSEVVVAAECLFIVLAAKFWERAWAVMVASRQSLERNAKVLADFMKEEHESGDVSHGEVDPVSMRGYKYLVWGDEGSLLSSATEKFLGFLSCVGIDVNHAQPQHYLGYNLITIEKVWNCGGVLLNSQGDPHNKLKDKCLSFALFKLLRLRYAGYSLPQKAYENAWKLIRDGLLSQVDGCERAFRVVEVELMFLFDFFYTKYSIIHQPGWWLIKLMELTGIAMGIWATTSLLKHHKRSNSICRLTTMPNGLSVDEFVTIVMIISFIIIELMQLYFMVFSEWAKVICICMYVNIKSWQGNAWIERIIGAICRVQLQKPWEQKLHQYSLLKSYSFKPPGLLNNRIMAAFIDQTRDGQKQSMPIELGKEVKQAVFDALMSFTHTKMKNVQASLERNNVRQLSWACRLEPSTQVIMVWHFATSFCEHQKQDRGSHKSTNFSVATKLSKYLAYLVAFAPSLLPGHALITEYLFNQAIIEARSFFKGCKTMEERVDKIKDSGSSAHEETIIKQGAALGNELVYNIDDNDKIWKILAEFWVELMLYVAPSKNAKAHAEHLARGGEFITHLWALLSHAEIERDHSSA